MYRPFESLTRLENVLLSIADAYDAATTYQYGDIVKHDHNVWEAIGNNFTGIEPSAANVSYWEDLCINCD